MCKCVYIWQQSIKSLKTTNDTIKVEIDEYTIMFEDSNTSFVVTDRSSKQKISKHVIDRSQYMNYNKKKSFIPWELMTITWVTKIQEGFEICCLDYKMPYRGKTCKVT